MIETIYVFWLLIWFLGVFFSPYMLIERRFSVLAALLRAALLLTVAAILIFSATPDAIMMWAFIIAILILAAIELFAMERGHLGLFFIMMLLALGVALGVIYFLSTKANAEYFDTFIKKVDGLPFENEIPDNMLRLTTEGLAKSMATQYMSELGGALEITDMQVTLYEGRLVWVAMVARKSAWGAKYATEGFVIVDANDPQRKPLIIKEEYAVAGGLSFNPIIGAWGDVSKYCYFKISTSLVYGDSYPVQMSNGEWALAVTAYSIDPLFRRTYAGVFVLDKKGNMISHYKDEVPEWLIQPFDEEGFLEKGITDWGGTRRGAGFDAFAGGFLWIPPSPDRLAITEDTRYVYDPDLKRVVAVVSVHYLREKGELGLAGIFKVTSNGITYFDLSKYNFMSGVAASNIIMSKLAAREGVKYFLEMPLFYPIKVGNQSRCVWFVPVYFRSEQMTGLAGLGVVDAEAPEKAVVVFSDGASGAVLVNKAKSAFRALFGEEKPPEEVKRIRGTVVKHGEPYVKEGSTRWWIKIIMENGEAVHLLVRADILSDREILAIQEAEEVEVEVSGDIIIKVIAPQP